MTAKKLAPDEDPILNFLRLKRHETPTADYFERFIEEFHRRRSLELIRRPIWKLAVDRILSRLIDPARGFAPSRRATVGAALALALVAIGFGAVTIKPWQTGARERLTTLLRGGEAQSEQLAFSERPGVDVLSQINKLSLDPNLDQIFLEESLGERKVRASTGAASISTLRGIGNGTAPRHALSAPRYVIDVRPVSHDSPVLSF